MRRSLPPESQLVPRPQRGRFLSKPKTYGRSVLGAPLQVWLPPRPTTRLVIAGTHGEETNTTKLLSAALRLAPPARLKAAVVLAVNPDGISRGSRGNANFVDLNRNCPASSWRKGTVTSRWAESGERNVELSAGSHPASEPEVGALLKLIKQLKITTIISLHTALACIDDPQLSSLGKWLSRQTKLKLTKGVGYETIGTLDDWGGENGVHVITYEMPDHTFQKLYKRQFPAIYRLLTEELRFGK